MRRQARTTYLSRAQIEQAHAATRSNLGASVYLRVSYQLYKKFAKMHVNASGVTLFDEHTNRGGRGIGKPKTNKLKYKLDEILMGKHPTYPREKLYPRIIQAKYLEEKCCHCNYSQKRATDFKSPLILHHINGNNRDHTLTNLEILCFNCYFVLVGNISSRDIKNNIRVMTDIDVRYTAADSEYMPPVDDDDDEAPITDTNPDQTFGNILTDQEKIDLLKGIQGL